MKLSVIIPVYNVEKYLRECLDSVVNQNFTDYEIICVEDGSTDASLEILLEYEKMYSQLKIIQHEQNKGLSAARNTGIKYANGKYIQFVDSDDMIKPETLKTLYCVAEENNVDIIYFNMEYLNDEINNLVRDKVYNKSFDGVLTGRAMFCLHQMENTLKPEVWRQFIRRDFLLESQVLFKEEILHEDVLFSFLLAMNAKRVMDLNLELYIYRQRKGSISWTKNSKRAASLFVCLVNICNYWLVNTFSEEEDKWISGYIEKLCTTFETYREYQGRIEPIGNLKEKIIYNIIFGKYSSVIEFDDANIEKLRASKMNIIYGAGKIAMEVLKLMKKYDVQVNYIAVTDERENVDSIEGIEVKAIKDLVVYDNAILVIGTAPKYHDEIIKTLANYKLYNYIIPRFKS